MKFAKRFATTLLLVLLLPLSSFAGDLQTPGCASTTVTDNATKSAVASQEISSLTSSTTYDSLLIEGLFVLMRALK